MYCRGLPRNETESLCKESLNDEVIIILYFHKASFLFKFFVFFYLNSDEAVKKSNRWVGKNLHKLLS